MLKEKQYFLLFNNGIHSILYLVSFYSCRIYVPAVAVWMILLLLVAATIITVDMFQLITVVSSLSLLSSNCCIVIAAVIATQYVVCCCRHCCCCFMGVSSLIISVSYHHTMPSMRCDQNIMIVVMLCLKIK